MSAAVAASPELVRVGVFAMAPFVVDGPNGPGGALVEFFDNEIAPRMGVRFEWERPTTMARLETSLATGRILFTPILAKTPSRAKSNILFAGAVYIRLEPCLAVLPDSPLKAVNSPADLENISIGWVQSGALPEFMMDKRIKLDQVGNIDWTSVNLKKLKLGRIGAAYFSNPYTPLFFAAQAGMRIRIINMPIRGPQLYGAFAPSAPPGLAERYARAAQEAFAHDRFSQYIQKAAPNR
ncbi:MAG: transporter substrate-binding domain-containing protein [Pseudomonadota bacterium]